MARRDWTRSELILAFNLYCKLPFGRYHRRNPEVIRLAGVIHRTPSAVAMKLVNFASFDPMHQRRGVSGLANSSRADRQIWDEFNSNWNELALESEAASRGLVYQVWAPPPALTPTEATEGVPAGEEQSGRTTEDRRAVRIRLGQSFFRAAVLASYASECCICRVRCRQLLVASHIIPWARRAELRLNPRNGLCLCAMHDRAFDRGLLTVRQDRTIQLSPRLQVDIEGARIAAIFLDFDGEKIASPEKFAPEDDYLAYHREHIFQAG